MTNATFDIIKTALKCDATVSTADRARIVKAMKGESDQIAPPAFQVQAPRIMTRNDVAKTFHRSLRFVDNLALGGVLKKVVLPGRKRAAGFLASDVENLITIERQ